VLRFTISEQGQPALPSIDLDVQRVVIGSGAHANIRLPAAAARPAHIEIAGTQWRALAPSVVDGTALDSNATGDVRGEVIFEIGAYRVRVTPAPANTAPSPPQRTESLARELLRGLLGSGAEPTLVIERGPKAGSRRALPPPEATLVIGRGDDADWSILDEDLSRKHVEIRRSWDGTIVRDLDSQNGTRVAGKRITEATPLRDGARIELGNLVLVFNDPADRQLTPPDPKPVIEVKRRAPLLPFAIAAAIALLAIGALAYLLAT
jgi:hypothetical protein